MNKRGIELSINFLVVIIIAVVVLTLGILFFRTMMKETMQMKAELDARTEAQLEELLMAGGGQQVVVARNEKVIERGDFEVFGVGILNTRKERKDFRLEVSFSIYVDEEGNKEEIDFDPNGWLLYDAGGFWLEQNEKESRGIGVGVDKTALTGTYAFSVKVWTEGEDGPYGGIKKIWVTVP